MNYLGKLIASYNKKNLNRIKEEYKMNFYKAFSKIINPKSNISVIQHIYGYFKEKLSPKEKKHFLNLIEEYKKGEIPLILLIEILRSFAYRFENEYILNQKYLNPFPSSIF